MQPHLAPHGLLMKLSPEPIEGRFSDSIVSADRNFWNSRTNELVEKPTCEINSQQAISYSRMRAAIAGLYERRSMPEEAEYAYQQARLICPQNVAVALMLADFYLRNNKDRECLAVLLDVQQHEPSSPELAETIQLVSERITRRLARGPEDQNKDSSQ
jgi:predicted Zn-dependent protease